MHATHDYGCKYQKIEVNQQNFYVDYVTAFAVVSATASVEMVKTFSSALNSQIFI